MKESNLGVKSRVSSAFGLFVVILSVFAAISFRAVQDPTERREWVLRFSDFVNSFDDATLFNTENNTYLIEEFAPVSEEYINQAMTVISGAIPRDVSGLFMRIGPNQIPGHFSRRYHLFDGHGMMHSVRITHEKSGSSNSSNAFSFYTNQYLKTPRYEVERSLNRSVFMIIGELKGLIGLIKILVVYPLVNFVFKVNDLTIGTANTAVLNYNGKLYAGHEGSLPFEFRWKEDTRSFESLGFETIDNKLDFPVTAHSKVDPVDGGWYFNGYSGLDKRYPMKYGYINSSLELSSYFGIPSPVINFAHDFSITAKYALLIESSVHFSTDKIMDGVFFDFQPAHKFRVGVFPKTAQSNDEVRWFTADRPYALVHTMTAWEETTANGEEEVVLWAPMSLHFDGSFKVRAAFSMHEVRMNMHTGAMTVTQVDKEYETEFPKVHPAYVGRRMQYAFANKFDASHEEHVLNFHGIVKYDLLAKKVAGVLRLAPGFVFSGECIPIPKNASLTAPGAKDVSGDVYLAAFVHNQAANQAEWHLYDGESMSQDPVVRLLSPARVPRGFHAEWMSEQQLKRHVDSFNSLA